MMIEKIKDLKNNLKPTFIKKRAKNVQEPDKSLNPIQQAAQKLQEQTDSNANHKFMMDLLWGWPGARARESVDTSSFFRIKREKQT